MLRFSRRQFVSTLSMVLSRGVATSVLGNSCRALPNLQRERALPNKVLFEQVPPSVSGIGWKHVSGRSSEYYLPETAGPGCAFLDYDDDGWVDIYLVNSGRCDFYDPKPPLRNALYRNNRDGSFTDVTEKAGVPGGGYGMGVAAGDYDHDGLPDIYLTQYGRSILYHNNGDGTFTDVTEKAGVAAPGWASSAVWFDYDNDGRLDLFVCSFVEFNKAKNQFCGDPQTGQRYYCTPRVYPPARSWLFHNNGNGTFTDVSQESGIASAVGKAWGVVAADINNDGWMDLFVANDTIRNFLFFNRRGKFEESGVAAGVAYNQDGAPRSGMGVDAADYDQDGWQDLFVDNIDHEIYSVYHNSGDQTFDDVAIQLGLGQTTRLMSGWGVKFFDYDNDGNLDLLIANGHPDSAIETRAARVLYKEPLLLFRNTGQSSPKTFENVSSQAGPAFRETYAARGLAIADFNNDGAMDVLVSVNDGSPLLLKNVAAGGNHWLGLRLIGARCNPDAIGARITWETGDLTRSQQKVGAGSYLSSHDPRVLLGLGPCKQIDSLEILWPLPSGRVDTFKNVSVDRYITIVEGAGIK